MDTSEYTSTSPDPLSDCREASRPSARQARKPIPRKGHTKSRRGCYHCKRRRIKCSELHPQCDHCVKAKLRCEYPVNIVQANAQLTKCPDPKDVVALRSTPGTFTMSDMRLFHHFLVTAYPHLPVGADKVWISVIPGLAHNHEYLIHAMLALAASHLDVVSNANVAQEALSHRILAVKSLNEALSVPAKCRSENDARMATALALCFQSSHLEDGLFEFLTMIRGCNLIAQDHTFSTPESAFWGFRESGHLATMQRRLSNAQLNSVRHSDLDAAHASLTAFTHMNLTPWEQQFHDILSSTLIASYGSPALAYTTFVQLYNVPSRWTPDEFASFIDPNNSVAQILLAHFIAIQAVLTPILILERVGFGGINAPTAVLGWIRGIWRNLDKELRGYVEWPLMVAQWPFMRLMGDENPQNFI